MWFRNYDKIVKLTLRTSISFTIKFNVVNQCFCCIKNNTIFFRFQCLLWILSCLLYKTNTKRQKMEKGIIVMSKGCWTKNDLMTSKRCLVHLMYTQAADITTFGSLSSHYIHNKSGWWGTHTLFFMLFSSVCWCTELKNKTLSVLYKAVKSHIKIAVTKYKRSKMLYMYFIIMSEALCQLQFLKIVCWMPRKEENKYSIYLIWMIGSFWEETENA